MNRLAKEKARWESHKCRGQGCLYLNRENQLSAERIFNWSNFNTGVVEFALAQNVIELRSMCSYVSHVSMC